MKLVRILIVAIGMIAFATSCGEEKKDPKKEEKKKDETKKDETKKDETKKDEPAK